MLRIWYPFCGKLYLLYTDGASETLVPIYQTPRRREYNYDELSQLTAQHTRTAGQNQNVVQ